MTDPRSIRVLVVDDDTMAANGMISLLETASDIEVVGRCSDGDEVGDALARLHPDVVLCDVRMPRMDGVAVVREHKEAGPSFLMMTAFDEDGRVLEAVSAGAAGFMLKGDDPNRILEAVRQVAAGDAAFSPRAAKQLTLWVRDSNASEKRCDAIEKLNMLTDRERAYVTELTTGATDAELGRQFFVADSTIKSALSTVRAKWGVRTRTELAVIAARAEQ
ncbi:response regulator [Leifsonia xyli]|uniref:response regulator n=1 Tax=Leifsonia xyli TaxID=1575 RepID=UPI003D666927